MENQRHPIIANHYFAHVSSECQLVFSSGCYYACIALCQSLAESTARFMYEKWTGNPPAEKFLPNIHHKIRIDVSSLLEDIYGGQQRQDFHHLNKTVPIDYEQLRKIATEKINLLNKVESLVFEYEDTSIGWKFKYPKYWESTIGDENMYLRFAP
jgi:hypothetical protein